MTVIDNKQKNVISFIIDRSGSMAASRSDMEPAINDYISKIKKEGVEAEIVITEFDTQVTTEYRSTKDDFSYSLVPGGMTALNDAVGRTISKIDEKYQNSKIVTVIVTDGEENSSREFTTSQVLELIESKQKDGWVFEFLAVGPSAWSSSRQFSATLGASRVFNMNSSGTTGLYSSSLANRSVAYFAGATATMDSADEETRNSVKG